MPRYFFEITYNGSNYAGWQSQANALGVQTVVENALTKLFRTPVKIIGSGRTDTGVHCLQQFFHADIEKPFTKEDLIHRLNSFLPNDIAIRSICKVKPDASARYDAVERTYAYHITTVKDPLLIGLALHYFKPLDMQTMNRAAALLCGEQDFTCFSKVKTDVNHFICHVKKARWRRQGARLVFTITANRFLRGMVRAIVGTLLDVGTGKLSVKYVEQIIKSKDRRKAGANVDPHGLYLVHVKYPKSIFL
ncbi:MAG: tRNA pseudouridine(38-40) synthase TruA [Flammeovirgaceae bacterium]|nr:MAG: tRNA pseudouridine(38-40) synthase TruA [Flammeovirgaceae bacterium]